MFNVGNVRWLRYRVEWSGVARIGSGRGRPAFAVQSSEVGWNDEAKTEE
jgi:hypothetical protein